MKNKKFKFIDLFAGAGGLSDGFISNGNFSAISHVEINKDACNTLRTRNCYYYLKENKLLNVYNSYLLGEISKDELYSKVPKEHLETVINAEISELNIQAIFSNIDTSMQIQKTTNIDLIIGGPPCQAYSLVGRAVSETNMKFDPRNYLYKQYITFLKHYSPKLFIFENVPGILTAQKGELFKTIIKDFHEVGYTIDYQILNAADFGVLQNRRRVIIIGWKNEFNLKYPNFSKSQLNKGVFVKSILEDLSSLSRGEEKNEYILPPNKYLIESGIRTSTDILTHHMCRKHNENDINIYSEVITAWNKNEMRLKYTELPDYLQTHKNKTSFLDRYKVLASNKPLSHTMIAHISKDGHHFIHPDISQIRSLSVREAARIQSFPDNFYFEGSRAAKYTQIGNAVPPLMAKGLSTEIQVMLEELL